MSMISTPLQLAYIDARTMGLGVEQAAKKAGYKNPSSAGPKAERSEYVVKAMAKVHARRLKRNAFTRDKVDGMIQKSFDVAELQSDASSMVRAITEINKMNGFYAAEEIKIDLSSGSLRTKVALEKMSTADLLRLTSAIPMPVQDDDVVDGEFEDA